MVRQCIRIEEMGQSGNGVQRSIHPPVPPPAVGVPTKLGKYRWDGSTMVFVSEESNWMHTILLGCWTTLLADAANVGSQISRKKDTIPLAAAQFNVPRY